LGFGITFGITLVRMVFAEGKHEDEMDEVVRIDQTKHHLENNNRSGAKEDEYQNSSASSIT
jgi:hypothetical protein